MKEANDNKPENKNLTRENQAIGEFYSNIMRVSYTRYDFEIAFRLRTAELVDRGGINVRLHPEMAAKLCEALAAQLSQYKIDLEKA